MAISEVSESYLESDRWFGDGWGDKMASEAFQVASYLTDPICKIHELFRRICVVDAGAPNLLLNLARKIALFVGIVAWASIAIVSTLPGAALRTFAAYIQKRPFIYCRGDTEGKMLPSSRLFTLLSWNICCIGGGYSISDGGVVPWSDRIDRIVESIVEKDADVNCLYETFDSKSAFYLAEKLREKGYADIYFNMGPKGVGVSSGIFVASKYNIKNPEFSPFPEETLVGRTKNASKGVFSFDLGDFAKIYSTHLQHSEEPEFPTADEVEARRRQMEIIVEKVNGVRGRCVIVTGDLNLDDQEYNSSFWHRRFQKGDEFVEKTWGGDAFCAQMVGKRVSSPLNLDHTLVLNGTARAIRTTLVETGYESDLFKEEALSDHRGLFSQIDLSL
jgi:hypothetical protein